MTHTSLYLWNVDVDECAADPSPCDAVNGGCTNNPGSYLCACNPGYMLNIDGIACDGTFTLLYVSYQS